MWVSAHKSISKGPSLGPLLIKSNNVTPVSCSLHDAGFMAASQTNTPVFFTREPVLGGNVILVLQRPIYPPYNSQRLDYIGGRFHPTMNETLRSSYSANAAPAPPTISIDHFAGSTPYCSKQFADTANSHLSETSALAHRYYIRNTHYKIHSLCGVRRP
jgi:hypothetical protein